MLRCAASRGLHHAAQKKRGEKTLLADGRTFGFGVSQLGLQVVQDLSVEFGNIDHYGKWFGVYDGDEVKFHLMGILGLGFSFG